MTKLEDEGVIAKDRVITIVKDFERGVFAMALRRSGDYDLRLYALPQTVRARIHPNSEKASFDVRDFLTSCCNNFSRRSSAPHITVPRGSSRRTGR